MENPPSFVVADCSTPVKRGCVILAAIEQVQLAPDCELKRNGALNDGTRLLGFFLEVLTRKDFNADSDTRRVR